VCVTKRSWPIVRCNLSLPELAEGNYENIQPGSPVSGSWSTPGTFRYKAEVSTARRTHTCVCVCVCVAGPCYEANPDRRHTA
jgi:hypothetical protein